MFSDMREIIFCMNNRRKVLNTGGILAKQLESIINKFTAINNNPILYEQFTNLMNNHYYTVISISQNSISDRYGKTFTDTLTIEDYKYIIDYVKERSAIDIAVYLDNAIQNLKQRRG